MSRPQPVCAYVLIPYLFILGSTQLGALPPPQSLAEVGLSGTTSQSPALQSQSMDRADGMFPGLDNPTFPSQSGISLSMSLRPIPARIVSLVQAGRYVEMRDLLGDNVAMRGHLDDMREAMGSSVLQVSSRPRVREVTTLPSWLCCFLSYLAVGTTDCVTRERLAYAILLIRESLRHGGSGWLEYDRLFRQQAAIDPTLQWNLIHPGLQATTILAQRATGASVFCSLCQDCDHLASNCALAQLQHQATGRLQPTRPLTRSGGRICHSWNEGACSYPGTCTYRHICSNCFNSSHPARECRLPPRSRPGPPTSRPSSGAVPPRSAS